MSRGRKPTDGATAAGGRLSCTLPSVGDAAAPLGWLLAPYWRRSLPSERRSRLVTSEWNAKSGWKCTLGSSAEESLLEPTLVIGAMFCPACATLERHDPAVGVPLLSRWAMEGRSAIAKWGWSRRPNLARGKPLPDLLQTLELPAVDVPLWVWPTRVDQRRRYALSLTHLILMCPCITTMKVQNCV